MRKTKSGCKLLLFEQSATELTSLRSTSQTPTLNAKACHRGVTIVLFLDLGKSSCRNCLRLWLTRSGSRASMTRANRSPSRAEQHEQVVVDLYEILGKENKEQYLKVYWYTGKDQIRPSNAVHKQRTCHIVCHVGYRGYHYWSWGHG
jgi:hypothetical protein